MQSMDHEGWRRPPVTPTNMYSTSGQVDSTDVVFLDSIQFTTAVGTDCWGRPKAQPVLASVYLLLQPSFLDVCGASDDVKDSVHYGHLAKAVTAHVGERERKGLHYAGVYALIQDVTTAAFGLAGESAVAVRVVIDLPKQILLASGFTTEVTTPRLLVDAPSLGEGSTNDGISAPPDRPAPISAVVRVKDLDLPVLIGVNPPERLARQRVITNITFYERFTSTTIDPPTSTEPHLGEVDYPSVIQHLCEYIDTTTYLTLEKLVRELCCACLRDTPTLVHAVTVRCEKPSAIGSARVSGVEMTRQRNAE
ncbi:hypothetical protein ID866_6477 [Astraeus odoratus]|nr:hypothetical protein ID866_6477 [Astraeus odoratus]